MPSVAAVSSVAPEVVGAQEPRYLSVPPMASSAGREAVDLAASVGLSLDPWQCLVLDGMLGEDAAGRHTAFETAVILPRQNGKNAILEARELWGLFLAGESLLIHTSHKFDTTLEHYRRMLWWVESNDWLRKRCKKPKFSHGDEGIELLSGGRLRILARSSGSGRGMSADFVALDEAFALSEETVASLLPALSARPDPQIVYTSSAGDVNANVLRAVRDRGRAGDDPALAYYEWCALPDDDLDDRQVWAAANPSIGLRDNSIRLDFIAKERSAMTDRKFGRERLGIWDDASLSGAVDETAWAGLADLGSMSLGVPTFAVAIDPDRTSAVVCSFSAGSMKDGHLEVVQVWDDLAGVPQDLADLLSRWPGAVLIVDQASPAGALLAALIALGVPMRHPTRREYAQACGAITDAVAAKSFAHTGDPILAAAFAGLSRRWIGESFVWTRKSTIVGDIGPAIAATLARWGHSMAEPATAAPAPAVFFFADLGDCDDDDCECAQTRGENPNPCGECAHVHFLEA